MTPNSSFESLPLANLRVWEGNPRRELGDITDLTQSIRAHGVLEPLLVRENRWTPGETRGGHTHDVIAGQRRFRAAQAAGLDEVPCLVREVDDADALEMALIENSQRVDAAPLDEATAINALVMQHGRTFEQVASKLGRPVRWVQRRLSLLALNETLRGWLASGKLPLGHAFITAALPPDSQARVATAYAHASELPPLRRFAADVQSHLHTLAAAPFDRADATLPGGPCGPCPKRSQAQPDLFDTGAEPVDNCLDGACWDAKVAHVWGRACLSAKKRHLTVIGTPDEVVKASWDHRLFIQYTPAAEAYALTGEGKPVALARTSQGHAVELFKAAPIETAPDEGEEDEEDATADSAHATRREEMLAAAEQRRANARTLWGRLVARVATDPHACQLAARVALDALCAETGHDPVGSVLGGTETHGSDEELVGAIPAADAVRVLVTASAGTWLFANSPADDTPWASELRGLLDEAAAPAVEAPKPKGKRRG